MQCPESPPSWRHEQAAGFRRLGSDSNITPTVLAPTNPESATKDQITGLPDYLMRCRDWTGPVSFNVGLPPAVAGEKIKLPPGIDRELQKTLYWCSIYA